MAVFAALIELYRAEDGGRAVPILERAYQRYTDPAFVDSYVAIMLALDRYDSTSLARC